MQPKLHYITIENIDMYTCCASLFSPINDVSDVYMCEYEKKNQCKKESIMRKYSNKIDMNGRNNHIKVLNIYVFSEILKKEFTDAEKCRKIEETHEIM